MDGFGDNFVPNGEPAVDPAADFLAREQEELSGLEDPPAVAAGKCLIDITLVADFCIASSIFTVALFIAL